MAASTGIRRPRQIGRPLADLVAPALGKTLAARGFAAADVVMAWPDIVGERLAGICEPVSLDWPRAAKGRAIPKRRGGFAEGEGQPDLAPIGGEARGGATLVMRVEGAFGLEVQHLTPLILERVNAYFGWRCAEKLVIRQGRVTPKAKTRAPPAPPDPQALAKGRKIAAGITDDTLREALSQLGALVLAKR
ncbi:hypothetical protein SAMN05444161_2420 [Rhizobiales bacterium GAS191]|nr:hypothetical protein SAMN05444161_2420 [Rhizobiales bacterium GAS191]